MMKEGTSFSSTGAAAARGALARGDFQEVHRLAAALVERVPDLAEGYFLLGIAEASAGRVQAGIGHMCRAVALDPQGEYRAQLARLYSLVRQDGDAAEVLRDAELALPSDALSFDTMGCVYARLGNHLAALPHFAEAVRLEPRNPEYRYNQAVTLNFLGRMAEAEAALEALIALEPDNARAHHLLASLRTQGPAQNHVERLRAARDRAVRGNDRLLIGYALAKELEDIGDERGAFDVFVRRQCRTPPGVAVFV